MEEPTEDELKNGDFKTAETPQIGLPEDIRLKLREPFPSEAIAPIPGRTYLSSVKAIYVVERLNDVFGIGGWTCEHSIVESLPEYVTVGGYIILHNHGIKTPYQYGGHKKAVKGTEPADGYKSAVTDLISKSASFLEVAIDVFKGKGDKPSPAQPAAAAKPQQAAAPAVKVDNTPLPDDLKQNLLDQLGKCGAEDEVLTVFNSYPDYMHNVEYRKLCQDQIDLLKGSFEESDINQNSNQ